MAIQNIPSGAPSVVSTGTEQTQEQTVDKAADKVVKPHPLVAPTKDTLAASQPTIKAPPVISFAAVGALGTHATTNAALSAFTALAATFAGQKPNGPVAEHLGATLTQLEGHVGPGVLTSSLITQTLSAVAALQSGELSAKDSHRVEGRLALLGQSFSAQNAVAQNEAAAMLTDVQRQALAQAAPHVQRAFAAVKKWVERAPPHQLGHAESAEQALQAGGFLHALPGYVSALDSEQGQGTHAGLTESAHAGSAQAHEQIEIPHPHLVALEQSLQQAQPAFAGMDIDSLVQLVMAQCAQDTDKDLEDIITALQKSTKQKDATRTYAAAEQKAEADGKTLLQTAYSDRCNLPAGNPLKIYPSITTFDQYSQMQKLVQVGTVSVDADGVPSGTPQFALSRNVYYFGTPESRTNDANGNAISQALVDEAAKLEISPTNMATLMTTFNADATLSLRFGSAERWILESTANGGVGLSLPAVSNQDAAIGAWRAANDPTISNPRIAGQYGISAALVGQLRTYWANSTTATVRAAAGSFENWLSASDGANLDATDHSANIARANALLSAGGGGGGAAVSTKARELMDNFAVSANDAEALAAYWDALPESYKNTAYPHATSAAALLTTIGSATGPSGAGITHADIDGTADQRHAKVTAFFTAERARVTTLSAPPPAEADNFGELKAAILGLNTNVRRSGDDNNGYGKTGTPPHFVEDDIKAFQAAHLVKRDANGIPLTPTQLDPCAGLLDEAIGELVNITIRLMHAQNWSGGKVGDMQALFNNAKDKISHLLEQLPEPNKSYATQYMELRVSKVEKDSEEMSNGDWDFRQGYNGIDRRFLQLAGDNGNHFVNSDGNDDWMDNNKWGKLWSTIELNLIQNPSFYPAVIVPPVVNPHANDSQALQAIISRELDAPDANSGDLPDPNLGMTDDTESGGALSADDGLAHADTTVHVSNAVAQATADMTVPVASVSRVSNAVTDATVNVSIAPNVYTLTSQNMTDLQTIHRVNFTALEQTDPLGAVGAASQALQAAMAALAAPVDHSIHQTGMGGEVSGEVTVGDIAADVTATQGKMDSFGSMGEQIQTRLQLYMSRREQFYQTLSNIMKKTSDTEDGIIANMK